MSRAVFVATALTIWSFAPTARADCGVTRWDVKVGSDPAAGDIDVSAPTATTVAALSAYPSPEWHETLPRITPGPEATFWTVDAFLVGCEREADMDYHLRIEDAAGNPMVTEIPSPTCASGSYFLDQIMVARTDFEKFRATISCANPGRIPVRIAGIGFFDLVGHAKSEAPNGIEIHPVLGIAFNPATRTPTPTVSATNTATDTPTTMPPETPITVGDVSCDGQVNSVDALFILQFDVGLRGGGGCPLALNALSESACDVNGDGFCNSIDALRVLQCDVGISNPLCPRGGP
jgi:hypothetical protein